MHSSAVLRSAVWGVLFLLSLSCQSASPKAGASAPTSQPTERSSKETRKLDAAGQASGWDQIVPELVSVFDDHDILALTDHHWRKLDSEARIRLVRHPAFARKVHFIVVEFASTANQAILDRYIEGDSVPPDELQQVWRTTTQANGVWDSPVYAEFLAAVREVNQTLPPGQRIRVFGGDPPPGGDRDASAIAVLEEQVLAKGGKALLIYGSAHVYRVGGITSELLAARPDRLFVVDILGGPNPAYQQFEKALKSPDTPVFVRLRGTPIGELSADDFLADDLKKRVNGAWVSAHFYKDYTLGQLADACIYLGMAPGVEATVAPVSRNK